MKIFLNLATSATMLVAGEAFAHTSTTPHVHPHLHTVDGALLGIDTLALVAVGLFIAACLAAAARKRARRKK